jgi:hypothetical protein
MISLWKNVTLYESIEHPIDGFDYIIGDYQPVAMPPAPYEPVSSESHIYVFFSCQVPAIVFSHAPKVRSQLISFVLKFLHSMLVLATYHIGP